MCAMFVCWLLCNDLAHVESAHLFSQYRTQNVFYIARVAMTLSIHLWTMERELQNYWIRIWLQASIFIYVAWNAAKILSLRHLSHLRNWLHAAAAANRLASSKRLKVSYIYIYIPYRHWQIYNGIRPVGMTDHTIRVIMAMATPLVQWSSTPLCLCDFVSLSCLFVLLRKWNQCHT